MGVPHRPNDRSLTCPCRGRLCFPQQALDAGNRFLNLGLSEPLLDVRFAGEILQNPNSGRGVGFCCLAQSSQEVSRQIVAVTLAEPMPEGKTQGVSGRIALLFQAELKLGQAESSAHLHRAEFVKEINVPRSLFG